MTNLPAFHDTRFTAITGQDGQPWVTSPDIARALGYSRPDDVARIYRRNAAEFTDSMTAVLRESQRQSGVVKPSNKTSDTRIFSLRGAHLIAMFAKTPRAAEFRRWVLDVLEGLATARPDRLLERLEASLKGRAAISVVAACEAAGLPATTDGRTAASAMLRALGWKRGFIAPRASDLPASPRGEIA